MQSAGFCRPAGATASPSHPFSASAPAGQAKKLSSLDDEQLELTEHDLWEDEAGVASCLSGGRQHCLVTAQCHMRPAEQCLKAFTSYSSRYRFLAGAAFVQLCCIITSVLLWPRDACLHAQTTW